MSREAEYFATRGRPPYKLLIETFNGPTSYTTGGTRFYSKLLKVVERAAGLQVSPSGHLRIEVVTGSVTGNSFLIRVWTGTSEIPDGTNLSGYAFTVLVEGLL
jgi:hypothetical protein